MTKTDKMWIQSELSWRTLFLRALLTDGHSSYELSWRTDTPLTSSPDGRTLFLRALLTDTHLTYGLLDKTTFFKTLLVLILHIPVSGQLQLQTDTFSTSAALQSKECNITVSVVAKKLGCRLKIKLRQLKEGLKCPLHFTDSSLAKKPAGNCRFFRRWISPAAVT